MCRGEGWCSGCKLRRVVCVLRRLAVREEEEEGVVVGWREGR